jgi:hypothetical protein
MIDRMLGAAFLEPTAYEEVEHDQSATRQALLVVAIGAVAAGIGSLSAGPIGLIYGATAALLGWAIYAFLAYWVGTNLFHGPRTSATWGELLRTLGFASSPRVLLVFAFIPIIGVYIAWAVFFWLLVTTVIAIRQALDFDTGRAIATAIVAWIPFFIISILLAALLL